jgi:hypothetical protein
VIGLGSLAAGGAAATGTGAFSAAEVSGRDVNIAVNNDSSALIQLIPGSDTGNPSATEQSVGDNRVFYENGQLAISFDDSGTSGNSGSGVAPNSTYQVGSIGGDAQDYLADVVDPNNSGALTLGDKVLYDAGKPKVDPAFRIVNESSESYDVDLSYVPSNPPSGDQALAAFVTGAPGKQAGFGANDNNGFALVSGAGNDFQEAATTLSSGGGLSFSLIVTTGDINPSNATDFSGALEIELAKEATGA